MLWHLEIAQKTMPTMQWIPDDSRLPNNCCWQSWTLMNWVKPWGLCLFVWAQLAEMMKSRKKLDFWVSEKSKKRRLDFYIFMIFILTAVDPSVLVIQSWWTDPKKKQTSQSMFHTYVAKWLTSMLQMSKVALTTLLFHAKHKNERKSWVVSFLKKPYIKP